MADWIEEGRPAPDFTLSDDRGAELSLASLRGTTVVLYFYPRDDTPGCTTEACAFRDRQADFGALKVRVLGISPDTVESHGQFRDKHQLNFTLLSDPDQAVAIAYGAWREKNMYGKVSMGIQRSTFIIDDNGVVRKVWKSVKVQGHEEMVLKTLQALLATRT